MDLSKKKFGAGEPYSWLEYSEPDIDRYEAAEGNCLVTTCQAVFDIRAKLAV